MKILFISDSPWLNSGYATVTRHLVPLISTKHEVIILPFAGPMQGGFSSDVLGVEILPTITNIKDIEFWYTHLDCDLAVVLKDPYAVPGIQS